MTPKEQAAAANALIGWCNSQEITPADAELVLSKVLAKIFVDRLPSGPTTDPYILHKIIQTFEFTLVNDTNERSYYARRIK